MVLGRFCCQKPNQGPYRLPPVAHAVFDVHTQLAKRLLVAFRNENGVVAKAAFSLNLGSNTAFNRALKLVLFAVLNERDYGTKPRPAVGDAVEFS